MATGQVKKYKRSKGYESLPRELLQDENLSLEAIGLLSYLQSLPETWILYKTQLYTQFKKNKRSSIDKIWKELVEQKYLLNFKKREGKKFVYHYIFSVVPFSDEDTQAIFKDENANDFWSVDFQQPKMNSSKSTTNKLNKNKSNINKLKNIKCDDDDILINKQNNDKKSIFEIIQESTKLKKMTEQLIESNVIIEEIEKIIYQFYESKELVDLNVVKQQLAWMEEKNKNNIGISSFATYFILGYKKRLANNQLDILNNVETEVDDLPNIPMYNWLDKKRE